ncbi:MAG: purine-nucleoside phosphorylase [Clostridia bacterium]|nr:purine-nucleoside phosphorylase [Clostridia bacterium]
MYQKCLACVKKIKGIIGDFVPETAVVLGSGLGGFAEGIDVKFSVNYADIPGFPVSTVKGHVGKLLFGFYNKKPIVAAQGRVHCYEGYTPAEAVIPVRVLKLLGADTIILTNAAGGINENLNPGDFMLITDHISFFADSPLTGKNIDEFGVRFPDMSAVYDRKLIDIALSEAKKLKIELKEGIYAQVKGPQYETPAEIVALSRLGAQAVGMSTAIEAIAAKHAGMRVCGISLITNMAAGIWKKPLSHNEVIESSEKAQADFCHLLQAIIGRI